jgi:hypothetical protein
LHTSIGLLRTAIVSVTIIGCATWQPFYQPAPVIVTTDAPPTPVASPTEPAGPPSSASAPTPVVARHKDAPPSSAVATPALITDSTPEQRGAAAKSVEEVATSIGRIDRGRLSDADAESYDLAVNLLASARASLANQQYRAAASLSQKASILLGTISAR